MVRWTPKTICVGRIWTNEGRFFKCLFFFMCFVLSFTLKCMYSQYIYIYMWEHPFRPLGRYPAHSVLSRFHESSGVIHMCDYKYVHICILIHTYIEYLYILCSKIGPKGVASKHLQYTRSEGPLFGMVYDTGFATLILGGSSHGS